MKESAILNRLLIIFFFKHIFKWTIIMFIIGSLIVFVINAWRFNPLAYMLCFFICLGLNLFNFYRKPGVKDEFKGDQ